MMEAGILMMFVMLLGAVFSLACIAAWIWALVDILKNDFSGPNKLIWLILVLALPLIGVILYYFIGREQKLSSPLN